MMNFSMTQEEAADNVTWIDSPVRVNREVDDLDGVDRPSSQLRYVVK